MKRRSAHVLSRSSAGAAVPFSLAALSTDLQRGIGSYLTAAEAVHGIDLASKECRSPFLAGVGSELPVSSKPLQGRRPSAREEDAYARPLVRLLYSMPALTGIIVDSVPRLGRIVGRALCLLGSPMDKVTHLTLWFSDSDAHRPHPVAEAVAKGCLPSLKGLYTDADLAASWDFLDQPANARLLQQAIQRGHLSKLNFMWMTVGPALDAALQGFQGMSQEVQQRQAPLVGLSIHGSEEDELDEESLKAALRTPCLSQLAHIACDFHMLGAVADYLGKEGGSPSISSLAIDLIHGDEEDIESFMNALAAEGAGAPNLELMHLVGAGESTLVALGAIYAAGGLTKLRTLPFQAFALTGAGGRTLFDAVGTTLHKGDALKKIEITERVLDEELHDFLTLCVQAFEEEFQAAQARGIFLNAQLSIDIKFVASEEEGGEEEEEEEEEEGDDEEED